MHPIRQHMWVEKQCLVSFSVSTWLKKYNFREVLTAFSWVLGLAITNAPVYPQSPAIALIFSCNESSRSSSMYQMSNSDPV